MRLGIVEKQSQAFPVAIGTVRLDLLHLGAAIPDLPHGDGSIQRHGVGRTRQWVEDAFDLGFPYPDIEIEIMLTVARRDCRRLSGRAGRKRRREETDQAGEDATAGAHLELHCLWSPLDDAVVGECNDQGRRNFKMNWSVFPRMLGSNTPAVCGSSGLARMALSASNLKPAASTSRRTVEGSMRCRVSVTSGGDPFAAV